MKQNNAIVEQSRLQNISTMKTFVSYKTEA